MRRWALLLGMTVILSALGAGVAAAQAVTKVTRYNIDTPKKFYIKYTGVNQADFSEGFLPGFGSGICLKALNKDGSIEFYGITDRGPNGDGPNYETGTQRSSAKFFLSPDFQPEIGIIRLAGDKAELLSTIGLKTTAGQKVTGLPIPPGAVGSTNEIALAETMTNLGYDDNGLDTEGISLDPQGNFWVCDEYGPFIMQFNKQGKMLKKFAPGDGLPEILAKRVPNRGFEGITVTPNGTVYGIIQSPLDIDGDGASGKTARFTRLVKIDPQTGKTAMYAYPIDVEAYKKPKDAKVGDLCAISDTKLLVIEQGTDKDKKLRNVIYQLDVSQATDITDLKIYDQDLEFIADPAKLAPIKFVEKKLICDLRANGWQPEKAEGLALLPDKKTLVVTNDNDFGISVKVEDLAHPKAAVDKYTLLADGSFVYKDQPAQPHFSIVPNDETERSSQLWLIELAEPLN